MALPFSPLAALASSTIPFSFISLASWTILKTSPTAFRFWNRVVF